MINGKKRKYSDICNHVNLPTKILSSNTSKINSGFHKKIFWKYVELRIYNTQKLIAKNSVRSIHRHFLNCKKLSDNTHFATINIPIKGKIAKLFA